MSQTVCPELVGAVGVTFGTQAPSVFPSAMLGVWLLFGAQDLEGKGSRAAPPPGERLHSSRTEEGSRPKGHASQASLL